MFIIHNLLINIPFT